MFYRLLSAVLLLSCLSCVSGCGESPSTEVSAPPAVVSENVDADRLKEAGGPEANVDYSKQN